MADPVVKNVKGDVITEAQKMHGFDGQHVVNETIVAANGTSDRLPPGHDDFYIGEAERKAYGIPDTMEPVWIRDDRYWKNKVPGNRELSFQRENAGGYVVRVDNAPVVCGDDLVLAVRPREMMDRYREQEAKDVQDFERRMRAAQETEVMDESDFDKENDERKRAIKNANTRRHLESGMIGNASPSQGMDFETYIRNRGMSADDIETEELSYARGRSSVSIDDLKEIAAEMAGGRSVSRGGGSGKFTSLPPNVRPRNLAKT